MKLDKRIIVITLCVTVATIVADMLLDRFWFYDAVVVLPLVGAVPANELLMRTIVLVGFMSFSFICARLMYRQKEAEKLQAQTAGFHIQLLNSLPVPVFYKDTNYRYVGCNRNFEEYLGKSMDDFAGLSVHDMAPAEIADMYHAKDVELFSNPGVQVYEWKVVDRHKRTRRVIFHKATYLDQDGNVAGMVGAILDVTELREAEETQKQLVAELQEALGQVKTLSGYLPICSSCKKIRDDSGYWRKLETYLKSATDVDFSHSICPDCSQQLFDEYEQETRTKIVKTSGH